MEACAICGNAVEATRFYSGEVGFQSCKVCGEYYITVEARILLPRTIKDYSHKVSSFLRERSILKAETIVYMDCDRARTVKNAICVDDIIKEFPKTISERLDKALTNLSRLTSYMGDYISLSQFDYPIFYPDSADLNACLYIMEQLYLDGYIENRNKDKAPCFPTDIRLTPKGWNRIVELQQLEFTEKNEVFVAMWFNDQIFEVYQKAIAKAIEDTGFKPVRVDFEEHNEKICDRIIADIKKSKFVICDFTGHRGGVYFEAGYAMGLGKPVIWTCREDDIGNLHFDTRQYNHVVWKDANELYERLKRRIEATIL
jgi:nucleoside 2-deoxyribosyltransferase